MDPRLRIYSVEEEERRGRDETKGIRLGHDCSSRTFHVYEYCKSPLFKIWSKYRTRWKGAKHFVCTKLAGGRN